MKRVLITGGSGFVGANLARRLLRDGHQVHLLLRPSFDPWRIDEICADVRLHLAEFTDREAIDQVVARIKPDWIFHLAVHGAYSWQSDWPAMVQTNVIGTSHLVDACTRIGFEAFVNTGSSSEYGYKNHAPTEDELPEPNSHYALTKLSATMYCQWAARKTRLRIPTLRLYSVYGPYEDGRRLIPTVIREGLQGSLPPLVNPDVARDYVYIDDVIGAYYLAAQHGNVEADGIYNVGTGVQTRLKQVVATARRVMHITQEPSWGTMPNRVWDSDVWVADSTKLQTQLGWRPAYTFEQGFQAMLDWHVARPMRRAA